MRRHPESGQRHLELLRWGLVPHFAKDLKGASKPINARSETAATSGLFRGALAQRRCLVPANAFYEWLTCPTANSPSRSHERTGGLWPLPACGMAGGSPEGETLRAFTIMTTAANAVMRPIHDRMPVFVEKPDWSVCWAR